MMYVFIYCYKYCGSWSVLTLLTDTIKNSSKRVNLKGLTCAVLFCFCFFNLPEVSDEDAMKKLEKRNDETTVSEARARYLQRKQQRQQSKSL